MSIEKETQKIDNNAIIDLIKLRKEEYLNTPLRIVEDYNNENKNIDEYNGRQLLEMIQNANDESDTSKAKKVLIKLDHKSLIIANNGNPFSLGGVESLMYSDLSPKTMEENKVGKKGLGFRSILNWSKEIYIASYGLHLKFSKKHANNFLKSLIEENSNIQKVLNRKTREKKPVSILRCPYIEENSSNKKEKEYDTVIELSLKNNVFDKITQQIEADIVPEILIFLNKLEEVEVQTPESHFSIKKKSKGKKIKIIKKDFLNPENNQKWNWNILEEKGKIKGLKESKNYELKIAYNPKEAITFHKLFSYFRTEIDFPFPVIAHGSFELKSDRNHLIKDENDFNIRLIKKLAKLLVDCALKLTKSEVSNYNALKLLIPNEKQQSSLYDEYWGFDILIKKYIDEVAIFPTIHNNYITLEDEPKFYEVQIEHLIPENNYQDFPTLLKSTSDESIHNYMYESYGDQYYEDEVFTQKINKLIKDDQYTDDQKIEWINVLIDNTNYFYSESEYTFPNLLINKDGDIIENGIEEVILPPSGKVFNLPGDLKLQFINKDFTEKLKSSIDGDIRDVSKRLQKFNVSEYSMTVVAKKIISSSHALLLEKNVNKVSIVSEMHTSLYHIFDSLKDGWNYDVFFQNVTSPFLLSRNGELKAANKLYFGKDYEEGYLCERLFSSIEEDVFVGSLEDNGIENLPSIEQYLKWIGVANSPRRKLVNLSDLTYRYDYVNYIFDNLNYPYSLPNDSKTFANRKSMNTTHSREIDVLWFEYFDEIVKNANFEDIIAWLISDAELYNCIVGNKEHDSCVFYLRYDRVQYKRRLEKNSIKSYILLYLKKQNFIPIDNGEKSIPTDCISNAGSLAPLVHSPKVNFVADIFYRYNIRPDQIDVLLNRLGVKENFKDLSKEVMYRLLNEHHKYFDKNKNSATILYNAIVEATVNLPKEFNWDFEERNEYLENGLILSVVNGKNKYVPVKEATYVLNPNHSQDLLAKLKVAKVKPRVGNSRILQLFGIHPVDYIEFQVKKPLLDENLNSDFQIEFQQLKPLLFVYRYQKNLKETQKEKELGSLKQLKIKLCNGCEVEYKINYKKEKLELKNNEYVFEKSSKTYFIKVKNKVQSYSILKQDYRFIETVSDIICGALTVTENRKDFMLIIGQDQSKWKEILTREFPEFSTIENEIMKNFEGALTSCQQFWKSVLKANKCDFKKNILNNENEIFENLNCKLKYDDFFEIYRGINYHELSVNNNYSLIKKLFESLDIDIKNFNKFSKIDINFREYHSNLLVGIHNTMSKKYKSILFSKEYSAEFIRDINEFDSYDFQEIEITNSLFLDLDELYEKELEEYKGSGIFELEDSEIKDVDDIYKSNLKVFKKQLQEENIFNTELLNAMLYENSFKNKIYFNKLNELEIAYKDRFFNEDVRRSKVKLSTTGQEIDITDYDELLNQIEKNVENNNLEIQLYSTEKVEKKLISSKRGAVGQSTNGIKSSIPKSDIGFIGEKYAFEVLKKKFDDVIWKSEYAIRAGLPEGKDGFGYDFECVKNGKTRFVEVKSTTTSNNSFYLSNNEVKVGHENKENYDILLISNLLSENIDFKYLKNIFKYKKEDTFFDNNSFLVETDGFSIKFK
ncbi:DUF3883 domain-containing protein [uncultured Polaribacter sp.]|uniref:DUF3883 domain-containing protein n=1 Tax=uncultured Polaribacter sp. TaxID=174711 RepID=UPI00259B9E7A|nr:DUF3883 domain-containing protein [uncultured Polaribacter sp.]